MQTLKAVLSLLPLIVRAALLWFRLTNYRTYATLIREANLQIERLEATHAEARNIGDDESAIRLLTQLDDARASRDALSAEYLALAGRPAGPNHHGDLHPIPTGTLAQSADRGGPGNPHAS